MTFPSALTSMINLWRKQTKFTPNVIFISSVNQLRNEILVFISEFRDWYINKILISLTTHILSLKREKFSFIMLLTCTLNWIEMKHLSLTTQLTKIRIINARNVKCPVILHNNYINKRKLHMLLKINSKTVNVHQQEIQTNSSFWSLNFNSAWLFPT